MSRLRFEVSYLLRRTPWDSGVTPPEVLEFLAATPPGAALDLGCGTGTNAITLAQRGWRVTAVDFSARALRAARAKAVRAGVQVRFVQGDVTRWDDLAGPYDFALDIGCFHGIAPVDRPVYAASLARRLRPAATFLLYSFLQPGGGWPGEDEIRHAFRNEFDLARLEHGEFNGRPSAWFTWSRRA